MMHFLNSNDLRNLNHWYKVFLVSYGVPNMVTIIPKGPSLHLKKIPRSSADRLNQLIAGTGTSNSYSHKYHDYCRVAQIDINGGDFHQYLSDFNDLGTIVKTFLRAIEWHQDHEISMKKESGKPMIRWDGHLTTWNVSRLVAQQRTVARPCRLFLFFM